MAVPEVLRVISRPTRRYSSYDFPSAYDPSFRDRVLDIVANITVYSVSVHLLTSDTGIEPHGLLCGLHQPV